MRTFLILSFAIVLGCSGSTSGVGTSSSSGSDGEALFEAPEQTEATPGSILGVWGGTLEDGRITFDTRWRLRKDSITLATRCTFPGGRQSGIVGITARGRVSDGEITFLESKKDENKTGEDFCRVSAQPRSFTACDGQPGFERMCFRLDGTTLTLYGDALEKLELVKLSD